MLCVFAAACMLWGNLADVRVLCIRPVSTERPEWISNDAEQPEWISNDVDLRWPGWPLPYVVAELKVTVEKGQQLSRFSLAMDGQSIDVLFDGEKSVPELVGYINQNFMPNIYNTRLVIWNAAICLALLVSLAAGAEWIIRRRSRRAAVSEGVNSPTP